MMHWLLKMVLHNCFPFTPIIMKLHTQTPMSGGCALLIHLSKGQGRNALITENGFWRIIAFPLLLQSQNLIHRLPSPGHYALMIWGKNLGEFELVVAGVFFPLGQPHSNCHYQHHSILSTIIITFSVISLLCRYHLQLSLSLEIL